MLCGIQLLRGKKMERPEIVSRKLDKRQKPFDEAEPKYWMGGSRSITEFIHSLSALFPEGEAFFIRSVKAFEEDERVAAKPQLLKDIRGFISQEGQHTAEHMMYNNKIQKRYGHDMERINV
jgi:uncharacterized protein